MKRTFYVLGFPFRLAFALFVGAFFVIGCLFNPNLLDNESLRNWWQFVLYGE